MRMVEVILEHRHCCCGCGTIFQCKPDSIQVYSSAFCKEQNRKNNIKKKVSFSVEGEVPTENDPLYVDEPKQL